MYRQVRDFSARHLTQRQVRWSHFWDQCTHSFFIKVGLTCEGAPSPPLVSARSPLRFRNHCQLRSFSHCHLLQAWLRRGASTKSGSLQRMAHGKLTTMADKAHVAAARPQRLSKRQSAGCKGSHRKPHDAPPARWSPRPSDVLNYVHAVVAAEADADGVARMDWTHGVCDAAGWQTAAYAIVRICSSEATNLVNTVAPGFLDTHGLKVGRRDTKADDDKTLHVGVEVLLSRTVTMSGAHYDSTPAVLMPITGTRTVWWAVGHETRPSNCRVTLFARHESATW